MIAKKNTAPGEDAVSYELINNTPDAFKAKILELYNKIWSSGDIPNAFKHAVVVPIPKPGKDPNDLFSYRPISLTSHLGKILETIINKRLVFHLEAKNILSETQAFVKIDKH